MTKRKQAKKQKAKVISRLRKGLGMALVSACSLIVGIAIGLSLDRDQFGRVPFATSADLATDFPENPKAYDTGAPQVLTPLRFGEWPDWLRDPSEGSRSKSQPLGPPTIAVVIDDLGGDRARTRKAIGLPAKVTLSFLPYPSESRVLSHEAHLAGHEIMAHLSMQPLGNANPGPMALTEDLAPAEIARRVDWALERVSDYSGANNHMGSRFTASRPALVPVMRELAGRRMYFLDSRTTASTQAEDVARSAGLLAGSRDVFLDDENAADSVERELARTEDHARKFGSAIAIGHPHPETLNALAVWTARLSERGFRLAPVSEVLELRANGRHTRSLSSLAD